MSVFSGGGGLRSRRKLRGTGKLNIPVSLGVRMGYAADVERPLPEGAAAKRQTRRIPAAMQAKVGGEWLRVSGDLSAGGALVLLPEPLTENPVELVIQMKDGRTWNATGEILRCRARARRFAHHIAFVEPSQVDGLDAAIDQALAAGQTQLETV